jgi:hypothetical protein
MPHQKSELKAWFDALVKNKMASAALCVAGIGVAFAMLTLAAAFSGLVLTVVTWMALVLMGASVILFIAATIIMVWKSW